MLPIINIFGRSVGSYALFSFMGLIVCGFVVYLSCNKLKIEIEDIAVMELIVAAGLLVGGHLLYGIVNIPQIIATLNSAHVMGFAATLRSLFNCFGGLVFYGGFLGGLAALKIYIRFSKSEFRSHLLDIYAFSVPLFHFFGRIGCFFAGCCYGIESSVGFITNNNTLVPDINGVRRFPVSLLEALLNLTIFIVLLVVFKKGLYKNKLIYLYFIMYSVVRLFTELLRGDSVRGIYFGVSTSQWIAIFLLIIGLIKIFKYEHSKKQRNKKCL